MVCKYIFLTLIVISCIYQFSFAQRQRQSNKQQAVQIDIPQLGKVRGRKLESAWTGRIIYQYFDIKYGESPRGERRFKGAKPVQPWKGVRNAFVPKRGCPSLQELDIVKFTEDKRDVEDCLFLTISTTNHSANYPVMVYIHGEFLYEGTNLEASPEYLLEKDIVLVSVRYRLAPFGFLSTQTEEIPGNAAIFDVLLALEWIQKYIHAFGGNPNSVTLFGQVGGAAIINVLTMSPVIPEGLFHKVIYMSGSAVTPVFTTSNPLFFTRKIAKRAGCRNTSSVELLNNCLLKMNASTLLEAFSQHGIVDGDNGIGSYGGLQFSIGGPSGILPENPGKLIQEKKIRYYPTMGGVTKNAGSFLLKEIFEDNFNETIPDDKFNGTTYIDYFISQTNGPDPENSWRKFVQDEIFNSEEIKNGTFVTMLSGIIDMCGTIPFKNPVLLALQANAEQLPNSTFLYSFEYAGEFNRYLPDEDDAGFPLIPFELGVSLTDDNLYLFPWPEYASYLNQRDTKISKRMVSLWTSFAKTGIPQARNVEWPPMTEKNGPYLKIDTITTIAKNFVDEYSITVKDARKGNSLILEEFFSKYDNEDEENQEDDYNDYNEYDYELK